jgi:LuxR family maltose regulon positive regulatory protein
MRALIAAFGGDAATALATIRVRVAEHPSGYGDWGLWHTLFMAGRVAASCGDHELLRDCTRRMLALQGRLTDVTPQRLHPLRGLLATQAWLEGRVDDAVAQWQAALEHEEPLGLLGQAAEVRVRLAHALLAARRRDDAAALLRPLLEADAAGPGGAQFARPVLRELSTAFWGATLAAPAQAMLRRWAAADTAAPPPATETPIRGGDGLSGREMEVLECMAGGASNKVIARALDLSPHTVKRHVANILDKLDVAGRAQAAAWWNARRAH